MSNTCALRLGKFVLTIGGWHVICLSAIAAPPARALTPQQIFAKDSPSIVVVVAYDASGQPVELGSGVVIATGQVVTNCHVVKNGATLRIKQGKVAYPATLRYADSNRDLCQLSVTQLSAPAVERGDSNTLKTGANVVAIGAPEGLELTISSGLVSSLRDFGDGTKIIQTSAAISPGSSGGGLFDEGGRLVGITFAQFKDGQNLNFALPVNWIAGLRRHPITSKTAETSGVAWVTTAAALEVKEDWLSLLQHAQRWTQAQPQQAIAWTTLGDAFGRLQRYPESLSANQHAIRLDPKDDVAWYNSGLDQVHLGHFTDGLTAFRQAVQLNPSKAIYWHSLGFTYSALKQYPEAVSAELTSVKLDPSSANAWNTLGNSYSGLQQYQNATIAYRQSLALVPNDADTWRRLGSAYFGIAQYPDAVNAYQQSIRQDPNEKTAWAGLGLIYAMQGNRDGANDAYQHLRTLDPALAEKLLAIMPQ